MRKKLKVALGVAIILVATIYGYYVLSGSFQFYMTVSELKSKSDLLVGERIRVGGKITEVLELDTLAPAATFKLSDGTGSIVVVYEGALPSGFPWIEGTVTTTNEAVAEGTLNSNGVFEASKLSVKCPSRYEPAK